MIAATALLLAIASAEAAPPQECPDGQHWVQAHHRSAYVRGDGVAVSATTVAAHCRSSTSSYDLWKSKLLSGMPSDWTEKSEKPKPWTTAERERVLEALELLPPALVSLPVKGIYRSSLSALNEANPASGNKGVIVLYDPAFLEKANLSRILAHELAHEDYRQLPNTAKASYANAAQWLPQKTSSGQIIFIPMREHFLEDDGKESPDEDFSNNIEYFLFNKSELKSLTPRIYDWIQGKYGDSFKIGGGRKP